MVRRDDRARRRSSRTNDYATDLKSLPFPFNRVMKGEPFAPYTCSSCRFFASEQDELDPFDSTIPVLDKEAPVDKRYSLCPPGEGPEYATLLSSTRDCQRYRVSHKIGGRLVTACVLYGVLARRGNTVTEGALISEEDLLLELHLRHQVETHGLAKGMSLAPLASAPARGLRRVVRFGPHYALRISTTRKYTDWDKRVTELSLTIQGGAGPGIIGRQIARVLDPRLGVAAWDSERVLFVPFNLSMPLQQQWNAVRSTLDAHAQYAYRFTEERRPREKRNTYRDVYIFLAVKLQGRTVRSVARDVFPREKAAPREKKVREAVRFVGQAVQKAGIALPLPPRPGSSTLPG